jgi:hypothetical protein
MWKTLDCGSGEVWRRSVGPMVSQMKKYYIGQEQEYATSGKNKEG